MDGRIAAPHPAANTRARHGALPYAKSWAFVCALCGVMLGACSPQESAPCGEGYIEVLDFCSTAPADENDCVVRCVVAAESVWPFDTLTFTPVCPTAEMAGVPVAENLSIEIALLQSDEFALGQAGELTVDARLSIEPELSSALMLLSTHMFPNAIVHTLNLELALAGGNEPRIQVSNASEPLAVALDANHDGSGDALVLRFDRWTGSFQPEAGAETAVEVTRLQLGMSIDGASESVWLEAPGMDPTNLFDCLLPTDGSTVLP